MPVYVLYKNPTHSIGKETHAPSVYTIIRISANQSIKH